MKFCSSCKTTKETSKFNKRNRSKDGLQAYCRTCMQKYRKEYDANNREVNRLRVQKWRKENPEQNKLNARLWQYKNKHKFAAKTQKRRAAKLNATPPWLNEDHKFMLEEIYELRDLRTQATGVVHHVDHIVPLRGAEVCGLHVPWNLQVIPASANIRKGNSYGNHVHSDY